MTKRLSIRPGINQGKDEQLARSHRFATKGRSESEKKWNAARREVEEIRRESAKKFALNDKASTGRVWGTVKKVDPVTGLITLRLPTGQTQVYSPEYLTKL